MNTELDRDDDIGLRVQALQSWQPASADTSAWQRVERRRRRNRMRRAASSSAVLIVAILVVGVAVNHSSATRRRVEVVGPTPQPFAELAPLRAAPVAPLDVSSPGPYRAGQSVRVSFRPMATSRTAERALNRGISVCYPWGHAEMCDPSIASRFISEVMHTSVLYELTVPGWVRTPTGQQSCAILRCRFEVEASDGRVGTEPFEIDAGSKPTEPARLVGVDHENARVRIALDGIMPDPSWTRWSQRETRKPVTTVPAGEIQICAFAARLLCDGLVQPDPPPFDGDPHTIVVPTNPLLLTPAGWVDCKQVLCAIRITKTIDPTAQQLPLEVHARTVAFLPYQVPATTPDMPRPTLTYEPAGPFRIGDTVTATLHDPPPNTRDSQLVLWDCSGVDLEHPAECEGNVDQKWNRLPDGSFQQQYKLMGADPNGTYLAVELPRSLDATDYPFVARSEPFTVRLPVGVDTGPRQP